MRVYTAPSTELTARIGKCEDCGAPYTEVIVSQHRDILLCLRCLYVWAIQLQEHLINARQHHNQHTAEAHLQEEAAKEEGKGEG